MFNIGPQELLLILVLALLVVGPQRLPEIARTIGKGMREFRKAQDEVKKTIQINLDEPSTATTRTPRRLPVEQPASSDASSAEPTDGSEPAPSVSGGDVAAAAAAGAATGRAADPEPSGVSEISRNLGRTLAELRRAREEVQRSFRMDADPTSTRGPSITRPPVAEPVPSTSTPVDPSSDAEGTTPAPASDAAPGDEADRPA